MNKASHSSYKKRMKEFAQLEKQQHRQAGPKAPAVGKASSAHPAAPRSSPALIPPSKTEV